MTVQGSITQRRGAWIQMFAGVQAWPLDVRPGDFIPTVLAHHLSLRCRWNGAVIIFFSSAQHSVLVSQRAAQLGARRSPTWAMLCAQWGLIHDLSDAFLPDIPSPMKVLPQFDFFREVEKGIIRNACIWLGLPEEEPEEVKLADLEVRETEARDLLDDRHLAPQLPPPPYPLGVEKVEPLFAKIDPEAPWVAERSFRARWAHLFPDYTPAKWDRPILASVT